MTVVAVEHLVKTFGPTRALDGLDLTVDDFKRIGRIGETYVHPFGSTTSMGRS